MLCETCQLTFQGRNFHDASFGYNHHQSASSVQASANQGCHLCLLLWSLLTADEISRVLTYRPGEIAGANEHVQITSIPSENALQVSFPLGVQGRTYESQKFCVKFLRLLPTHDSTKLLGTDDSVTQHEVTTNTGSAANFALARQWLRHCETHHSICGQLSRSSDSWYPSRLLKIYAGDTICLQISGLDALSGPYLSLSHCWGSALVFKLTERNLESFRAGIPYSSLPKTFQDAILVTQQLGLNLLWIDALCIIQDSENDWRQEAASMGKVYQNALCNIAATGALNSTEGCFWDRNPLLAQACKIDLTWKLPLKGSFFGIDRNLWTKNVGEAPLNYRGWVVQERILSPRILHFARQQLFWECHEIEACESFPGGLPESPDPMTFVRRTGLKRIKPAVRPDIQSVDNHQISESTFNGSMYWDGIVDIYTRSALTRQEDKIIALSGIAKEMSFLFDDQYLAGLWKHNLPYQLLWQITNPLIANHGNPCFRPLKYRAPTWSWASIEGRVVPSNRYSRDWHSLPSRLEGYVIPVESDVTGQIRDARLDVKGRLRLANWQCVWHGHIYGIVFEGIIPEYSHFWPDELIRSMPDEVYCFPLLTTIWDKTTTIDGLVLSRIDDSNSFKRIGTFRYQDEEDCWLLLKSPRDRSAQGSQIYEDLEEQTFTIV